MASRNESGASVRRTSYVEAISKLTEIDEIAKLEGYARQFIENSLLHLNEAIKALDRGDHEAEREHRVRAFGFQDDE